MELASKIRAALNYNSRDKQKKIREVYFEAFGKSIKKDCGNCYNEAIGRLLDFVKQKRFMTSNKYRFKKEHRGKRFSVVVNGTRLVIDDSNVDDFAFDVLEKHNRLHLVEQVVFEEPKKSVKEVSQPTLSTSKEVLTVGKESNQSVSESELNTSESKPLTAAKKKRGRPSKV